MRAKPTVILLENPWRDPTKEDEWASYSALPFVKGLCDFYGVRCLYRTFSEGKELLSLVGPNITDKKINHSNTLLYITSHGDGGRVATVNKSVNIKNLLKKAINVSGIWLGMCYTGKSKSIKDLKGKQIVFVGGYTKSVYWWESTLIDQSIIRSWIELILKKNLKNTEHVKKMFADGLAPFKGKYTIGEEDDKSVNALENSIAIFARDSGKGNHKTTDIANSIFEKLSTKK